MDGQQNIKKKKKRRDYKTSPHRSIRHANHYQGDIVKWQFRAVYNDCPLNVESANVPNRNEVNRFGRSLLYFKILTILSLSLFGI